MISGLFMSIDSFSLFNIILVSILFIFSFFFLKNKNMMFILNLLKELELSMPMDKILNQKKMLIFFFIFITLMNFFSLFSHIYSFFSLISMTLILSLTVWLSMIFINLIFFLKEFFLHLTPLSTPLVLMSFMVLIELISQFIRPITLMVRLATNLTTGHLILGLISNSSLISFLLQIPFFILEMMVAIVQSYVFCLLLSLYLNE